ncbi:hypothetical protein RFI_16180 [Reticulomyxa filosa]|uniref:Uncharacterized protein n=1 Tax=Reticulomyxa filosa TaxID=46433 RepID=X6N519_RETFI|nr:hypothetical protein RFI_16180 [Reticulomyxa filosa]|eukprot:ETO21028.1 hypothetical protein RFI_16180 [Reticulomyxa filosa]
MFRGDNKLSEEKIESTLDEENSSHDLWFSDCTSSSTKITKPEQEKHVVDSKELTKKLDQDEPILTEQRNRFVLFPIQNRSVWEMYKKHVASFWTAEEIDLSNDHKHWQQLNDNERHFIKTVLAFFAARSSNDYKQQQNKKKQKMNKTFDLFDWSGSDSDFAFFLTFFSR